MSKKGKDKQAGKKGEALLTGWLGGGFSFRSAHLFSHYPTLGAKATGLGSLEPNRSTQQQLSIQHKGDHPFRDDSPKGRQFNIYKSQGCSSPKKVSG